MSSSTIKFIEKALLATGSFALSYTDPDQKWIIRKHLTSFLQYYPNFELSTDTFNHNNGNKVQLFLLEGSLHTKRNHLPTMKLTIWVHENYPLTPPLVFITSDSMYPIRTNHPFVNTSGFINSSYIETWEYPRCNLLDFVRNLKKVLTFDHPLAQSDQNPKRVGSVSRNEALDRLATSLHYDVLAIVERSEEEIESLWRLQSDLKIRSDSIQTMISELESEKEKLKEKAEKVDEEIEVLTKWVKTNGIRLMKLKSERDVCIEEMFDIEEGDEEDDAAIEDVLRVLEEAMEKGEMEIGLYLKQVRVLAREQFFCRFVSL